MEQGGPDNGANTEIMAAKLPVWFLTVTVLVLLFNRVVFYAFADPLPDEAYYWLWGQHPDFSYFDHPPLQAWFQAITTGLFGQSLFVLRLPAMISSLVLGLTLLWWIRKFAGAIGPAGVIALIAAAFSSPLIFMFSGIVFNDHLLIALLSVASILVFVTLDDVAQSGRVNKRALYGAALVIGLAGLTKYNASVFAIGVVVATLMFPRFRPLMRSPHLYLAGLVCLACLAPVFWWNYTNDAASFQYNLNDRLTSDNNIAKVISRMIKFLIIMALSLSPFLMIPAFAALKPKSGASAGAENWRKLAVTILVVAIIFCLVLSYFTYVLYYWSLIAFVAILPFAVLHFAKKWQLIAHMVYGLVIISVLTFNFTAMPVSAFFGKPDHESAVVYGWSEISAKVSELEEKHGVDFIATSDYRTASILAFRKNDIDIQVIAIRASQFSLWFDEDLRAGQDAIILTSNWFPMRRVISDRFQSVEELETISISRFGFEITKYKLYLAKDYSPKN